MIISASQAIDAYRQNSQVAAMAVCDSAGNLLARLDDLQTLAAAGKLLSLTIGDSLYNTSLSLSGDQLSHDALALGKLFGCFDLIAANNLTAAQAASLGLGHVTGLLVPVAVADSAAAVQAHLGALQALAAAGKLASITLTDSGAAYTLPSTSAPTLGNGVAPGSAAVVNGDSHLQSATDGAWRNQGSLWLGYGSLSSDSAIDNSGSIEVHASAHLIANAALTNRSGGQIIVDSHYQYGQSRIVGALSNDGQIAVASGILQVDGPVSGGGTLSIGDGSLIYKGGQVELILNNSVAAGQHLSFASGEGVLRLGLASGFHGSIDNFSFHDRIDLLGLTANATRYDAASATLSVLSGSTVVASFSLPGGAPLYAYSDDHGGTWLSLEPRGSVGEISAALQAGPPGNAPLHNWSGAGGTPVVSYSLGSDWSASEAAALNDALALWSGVANIRFQAAAPGTTAQIEIERTHQGLSDTSFIYQNGNVVGARIGIDTSAACWSDIVTLGAVDRSWGNAGFTAVLHELGHALGLSHPANYSLNCSAQIGDQVDYTDTMQYSLMSYFESAYSGANWGLPGGSNLHPQTPMLYDIQAVQNIYGANTTTLAGNLTFGFNSSFGPGSAHPLREYDFSQNPTPALTLWAGGDNNTLDLSGFSANATVNLTPGAFSSVAGYVDNLAIAYGCKIDRAIGGSGDDRFTVNADNDWIDGGGGNNTVVFGDSLANFSLSRSGANYLISSHAGAANTVSASNIGQLVFADMTVRLDMPTLAASLPAADLQRLESLYLAFYNRVPDANGLAYWIGQLSSGTSMAQVATAFYDAGLAYPALTGYTPGMSDADFINVVYRNVLGRSSGADAGGLGYWGGQLASGQASRASLVASILDAAQAYQGDATWGWVADLLHNKVAVANQYAVSLGLSDNSDSAAISHGMAIAAAVTATDTTHAVALIGIDAANIHLL